MTKKKLDEAVEYYGLGKEKISADQMRIDILADEYTNEEADEILAVVFAPEKAQEEKKSDPKNPNASLDLSGFDYKKLNGDSFKKYVALVGDRSYTEFNAESGEEKPINGKLSLDDSYDFQLFRCKPVRKQRFPGVQGTPWDYVGLELVRDTPDHASRMTVRHALEFNAQIMNAHSMAGHGKYYLLKK